MTGLADDVRGFILEKIDSLEQLEILLLLHAEPSTAWSVDDIASRLRNDAGSARRRAADLVAKGLFSEEGGCYRYAPRDEALAHTVDALSLGYAERRVAVINLIFSKPLERIQVFADAFRIRKGKDDG